MGRTNALERTENIHRLRSKAQVIRERTTRGNSGVISNRRRMTVVERTSNRQVRFDFCCTCVTKRTDDFHLLRTEALEVHQVAA